MSAFCAFLEENGWEVQQELDFVDVAATRAGITLLAEAKGRTSSPGLDVDTLYGRLLRRIPGSAVGVAMLAVVVVPTSLSSSPSVSPPRCAARWASTCIPSTRQERSHTSVNIPT